MAKKKKGKAKSKSARRKTMKKKSSKKVSRTAGSRKPKLLKGRGKGKKGRDKFSFDWNKLENPEWKADWDDDAGDFEGDSGSGEY